MKKSLTFLAAVFMIAGTASALSAPLAPTGLEQAPVVNYDEIDDLPVITPSQVGPSTLGCTVRINQVLEFYRGMTEVVDLEGESCKCSLTISYVMPAVLCWSYDIYGDVKFQEATEFEPACYYLDIQGFARLHSGTYSTAEVKSLKALYTLVTYKWLGEYFCLTGHFTQPLIAVYHNGNDLYVRDINGDYGLVPEYIGSESFTNGDTILDTNAKPLIQDDYRSIELISCVRAGHGPAVEPEEASIGELSIDMQHHYVVLRDVVIAESEEPLTHHMTDATGNESILRNHFNLNDIPTDGTKHDVWGFVSIKNGVIEVFPISIDQDPAQPLYPHGDVDGDMIVNISDVTALIDILLGAGDNTGSRSDIDNDGVVNISDVTALIDILLKG